MSDKESDEINSQMINLNSVRNYTYSVSTIAHTSALAHFYRTNYWAGIHLLIGLLSTILSVAAGTSILSRSQEFETVAGLMALVASVGIAVSTFLNPNKQSKDHYNAATSYLNTYHNAQLFYEVESKLENKNREDLVKKLSELIKTHNELDKKSPRIPTHAWEKAQKTSVKHFARMHRNTQLNSLSQD